MATDTTMAIDITMAIVANTGACKHSSMDHHMQSLLVQQIPNAAHKNQSVCGHCRLTTKHCSQVIRAH